jgi:glycosyltransferase involved in cell wall biosynthesis
MVHNHYQQGGGEDIVFAAEVDLLRQHGHDIECLEFNNDQIPVEPTPRERGLLALNTIWSKKSATRVRNTTKTFNPEVVHFHNTFPLISAAAYGAARSEGAAVVQTLHNYRLLCPSATFFRDGHVCEECLGKTPPYPTVLHGCYRDSRSQTTVVAAMVTTHRIRRALDRDLNRYITLTEFAKNKFIEGGLPEDRIIVKPNFVVDRPQLSQKFGKNFLFVGRLSPE